ncbi:FAD-dependent oxidoreductase [Brevibacterium sp. 5221]|uniref:FAD-dependent oxidoreductase n=1 Tax=Brevibacterium rongguiense TaxID=2695267 RepID=A0A6N9H956_9MICO|nr:NAD(P)/FAD-dependent oxidoreductase [Brevibacterium rongguiense]MYM20567.1 FAD-dependent oxidoreductase [Brevibacterium rongguiense]
MGPGDEPDVVVIGGGPTGENAAQYALDGGLSAVLVEGELLGGECSYYACMPSKALLRPVDIVHTAQHLPGAVGARLDPATLLARRDAWVSHYDDHGQERWAAGAGIGVVRGHGQLSAPRTVTVTGPDGEQRTLRAGTAVVIATGSEAVVPAEFEAVEPWTSRDATGVTEVSESLLIVGGGVVAVEAATWLAALGSQVTLLVRGQRLLAGLEPFAGELVAAGLREAGVRVEFGAHIAAAARPRAEATGLGRVHGGPVSVDLADGRSLTAAEVLVAAGRRPRLAHVGLEAVGLDAAAVAAGRLPDWLHVIGDAGTGAPLTHMGKYEARVLGSRLAGATDVPAPADVPVPQVVFAEPQVAAVGLTEERARERLGAEAVATSEAEFTAAAGAALLRDDARGRAKLVIDRRSGAVVGATFAGPEAGELLHAATIAIVGEVPVSRLRHAVPAYPTASELWLRLLEALPRELR